MGVSDVGRMLVSLPTTDVCRQCTDLVRSRCAGEGAQGAALHAASARLGLAAHHHVRVCCSSLPRDWRSGSQKRTAGRFGSGRPVASNLESDRPWSAHHVGRDSSEKAPKLGLRRKRVRSRRNNGKLFTPIHHSGDLRWALYLTAPAPGCAAGLWSYLIRKICAECAPRDEVYVRRRRLQGVLHGNRSRRHSQTQIQETMRASCWTVPPIGCAIFAMTLPMILATMSSIHSQATSHSSDMMRRMTSCCSLVADRFQMA